MSAEIFTLFAVLRSTAEKISSKLTSSSSTKAGALFACASSTGVKTLVFESSDGPSDSTAIGLLPSSSSKFSPSSNGESAGSVSFGSYVSSSDSTGPK